MKLIKNPNLLDSSTCLFRQSVFQTSWARHPQETLSWHTPRAFIIENQKTFFKVSIVDLITLLGRVHVLVVVLDAGEDAEEDELLAGDADGGPGLYHARLYPHLRTREI